jgi:two-component system LytT family response regulator
MPKLMKVMVVDDEPPAIDALCFLIKKYCREMEVVATANNHEDALLAIEEHRPQVLFLDIHLGNTNDISWLDQVVNADFDIVIVSAFNESMLESLKLWKSYYLLKPIDINEFLDVYERIISDRSNISRRGEKEKYLVKTRSGNFELHVKDIIRMRAEGSYAEVVLLNGKKHVISKNLRLLLSEIDDERFFRVSRSAVVNLNHIKSVDDTKHMLTLADGTSVELAQRRKTNFIKVYRTFIEKQ